MFHCDEAGRVLFFTSPPTDTGAVMPLNLNEVVGKGLKSDDKKNGEKEREVLKLGHSVRYLGAKQKRDELVAAKRKREAEDEAAREGQRKKTKLAQAAEIQKRFDEVTARAIDALGEQLAVETKRAMLENAGGEKGIKEVRREVELLEARWRVEAEKERARTERQTMRDKREDKRVEILG